MAAQATSATALTTRCPQCFFHHDGAAGSLCATCAAKAAAGPLVVIERREDWAVHAAHLHFPTTTMPEIHDAPPEATEKPVPQKDSTPEPPARPAPARPRRPSRQTLPPQACAYEPCGRLFSPKKAGQRFHSVRCSARWRVAQDGGTQLRRAATRPRHTTRPGPDLFVVQVRDELAVIEALVTVLHTRLQGQQALLEKHQRQAACLRQYLALAEEPSP